MSEQVNTGVITETPNAYVEAAQERVLQLRKWRDEIPHFAIPQTSNATKRLAPAASVPPEFIELSNVAVANETALVRGDGVMPPQVRDLVAYADSFEPLADELEALATFLRFSTTAARNTAGTEALTTFALARRLAKQAKYGHLKPAVEDMRRALGRSNKRSTPEEVAQRLALRAAKAAARVAAKAKPHTAA
jgi:hypothetical protein